MFPRPRRRGRFPTSETFAQMIEVSTGPMGCRREATRCLLEETQILLLEVAGEKVGASARITPALLTLLRRWSSMSAKEVRRQMLISRLVVQCAPTLHAVVLSTVRQLNRCRIRASDCKCSYRMV